MSRVAIEIRLQPVDASKVGEACVGAVPGFADARDGLGQVAVWVGELDSGHDQRDCQQSHCQPATSESTGPHVHSVEANLASLTWCRGPSVCFAFRP